MKNNVYNHCKFILTALFFFSIIYCYPQKDTITIKEVEISSERVPTLYSQTSRIISVITRQEIQSMPVQTIDEVLKFALNVDVRNRGDFNVQSDISIRGGSSEQTLILLNGVKINDPQTSHHNINIPVDINDIERIEILEGPGSRIFGPNAFSGAINIITTSNEKDNVKIALTGGEHNYYSMSASATMNTKSTNNYFSLSKKGCDGYIPDTDFDISNLLYQGDYKIKKVSLNLLAAYQDKAFGAFNFYSAQPPYQNEFEHTKTSFLNLKTTFGKKIRYTANFYWRTNQDKFELFRSDPPSWYTTHNYHLTNIFGLDVNASYESRLGKTALGAEVRREAILSNVLGDKLSGKWYPYDGLSWGYFDHRKLRDNLNIFLEHVYTHNNFSASAGLLVNSTSGYKLNIYPGADISYKLSSAIKAYVSANKSLRIPSFTDLYYSGPTNYGNSDLKPEEAWTYEAGLKFSDKYFNSHLSFFRRYATNTIDWIKQNSNDTKWQSMNLTKLTTDGIEFSLDLMFNKIKNNSFPLQNLNLTYSYINASKTSGDYISFYALDYLRNKFTVTLNHKIYKSLSASWAYSYNQRAGSYIEYPSKTQKAFEPYSLFDGRLTFKKDLYSIFLEASNIFNKSYIDIGNINMPGRWIKGGIIIKFKY